MFNLSDDNIHCIRVQRYHSNPNAIIFVIIALEFSTHILSWYVVDPRGSVHKA
jgi:hypothetical protein